MSQKYAFQGSEKNTAKAFGSRLPISTKQSVMICKAIKGKTVDKARNVLQAAVEKDRPIKFSRFKEGAGHKRGAGPGKYPVKACGNILKVLNSAEANAQHIGLSSNLVVEHAAAHQASRGYKYGRHRGRKEKSTHVEIVLREVEGKNAKNLQPKKVVKESDKDTEKEAPAKKDEKPEAEDKKAEKTEKESKTEVPARSTVEAMTKDEIKDYAKKEFNVELTTDDLKAEMIDKLLNEIGGKE